MDIHRIHGLNEHKLRNIIQKSWTKPILALSKQKAEVRAYWKHKAFCWLRVMAAGPRTAPTGSQYFILRYEEKKIMLMVLINDQFLFLLGLLQVLLSEINDSFLILMSLPNDPCSPRRKRGRSLNSLVFAVSSWVGRRYHAPFIFLYLPVTSRYYSEHFTK